jgi:hypothetical protein
MGPVVVEVSACREPLSTYSRADLRFAGWSSTEESFGSAGRSTLAEKGARGVSTVPLCPFGLLRLTILPTYHPLEDVQGVCPCRLRICDRRNSSCESKILEFDLDLV